MARLEEKGHEKIVTLLADSRCSPAVLARLMIDESRYVNESFMGYFINYVIIMANQTLVPMHLVETHNQCKTLYLSLQELGLTGTVGRMPHEAEYLQV